ncbi:replicative DNA helicase [Haemophilus influenzae R3021]|uniref:Replicative DNA helicase n=1 Tax=Haemophilus influenzae R3021 TaxID=375432 RepID=A4N4Y2_HAEIF|nr:replicative DNA helicase [Haemophilus influenzae R3021]
MTDKLIASIEAESAVIGALIIDNDKFDEIATLLRSDDFLCLSS